MPPCEPLLEQATCLWSDGTRRVAVHLSAEVTNELTAESRVAFKRVPRRGLEIGGVLLGRKEGEDGLTTFWIDSFLPLDCEHRSGPSYLLSDSDHLLLQTALASHATNVVGLYRSHTRSDKPWADATDVELVRQCFGLRDALMLILGPAAAIGDLFLHGQGALHCMHEFALPSAMESMMALRQMPPPLPGQSSPDPRRRRLRHVEIPAIEPAPPCRFEAGTHRSLIRSIGNTERGKRGLLIVLACLILTASVSALSRFRRSAPLDARRAPVYLNLTVERSGSALRVVWDRNSPAVQSATRAVLQIDDGADHIVRNLTAAQLKEGSGVYEPKTLDQTFRLDLYSTDPEATGIVKAVHVPSPAGPRVPSPIRSAKAAVSPVSSAVAPTPHPAAAAPALDQPQASDSSSIVTQPAAAPLLGGKEAPDVQAPVQQGERPRESTPTAPERPQIGNVNPQPASVNQVRTVRVSAEPVLGSRLKHFVGGVPLLRRLGRQGKPSPPVPIYRAPLVIGSIPESQKVVKPVFVDVKLNVAASGTVQGAEVVDYGDPPNWVLADSALAAARRWTFQPARVEDTPVASDVILHFEFLP